MTRSRSVWYREETKKMESNVNAFIVKMSTITQTVFSLTRNDM